MNITDEAKEWTRITKLPHEKSTELRERAFIEAKRKGIDPSAWLHLRIHRNPTKCFCTKKYPRITKEMWNGEIHLGFPRTETVVVSWSYCQTCGGRGWFFGPDDPFKAYVWEGSRYGLREAYVVEREEEE